MNMKYIRTEKQGIIIWSNPNGEGIMHKNMWEFVRREREYGDPHDNLISAGFVGLGEHGILECYGESESLNLGGRADDDMFLRKQLGFIGVK